MTHLHEEENDVLSQAIVSTLHSLMEIAQNPDEAVSERLDAAHMVLSYASTFNIQPYDEEEPDGEPNP